ncbi:ABC transporter ATP-binding protein [Spirochaeta dissipatitropha]
MALEVQNLKIYYNTIHGQVQALDDVSFRVNDGEILGIAGESGCGKTTLSMSLVRFRRPMSWEGGHVSLDGQPLLINDDRSMKKKRFNDLSIIPQYALNALNPILRIENIVRDLAAMRNLDSSKLLNECRNRLDIVRLPAGVMKKYPIELSGGMMQRVVMVISTLLDPSLLLCDEITSALDVTTQKLVSELIVEFRDQKLVNSVTFVTHDVPVLYQIADRIMILYAGQLAEIGNAEEIIHRGRHPYTQALVGAMPEAGVRYDEKKLYSIPGRPPALLNPPQGCRFRERCPLASEKCLTVPPPTDLGNGHIVHCWEVGNA